MRMRKRKRERVDEKFTCLARSRWGFVSVVGGEDAAVAIAFFSCTRREGASIYTAIFSLHTSINVNFYYYFTPGPLDKIT